MITSDSPRTRDYRFVRSSSDVETVGAPNPGRASGNINNMSGDLDIALAYDQRFLPQSGGRGGMGE